MTGDHGTPLDEVRAALAREDHEAVLRLTDELLAERPGDDAAHEYRARSLLALGQLDEAEQHAQDAVRLDPDEIRYRELLARVLSEEGAHRDAAAEFGRLARNDPREAEWTLAEAREALADARWLGNDDAAAFDEFRTLANELGGAERDRIITKARTLYRQHAGLGGRLIAGIRPLFAFAFRSGWISVG